VVEGTHDLNQLATVCWRESMVITKESGGMELEQFHPGEKSNLSPSGM
jgi:hypothetical protein